MAWTELSGFKPYNNNNHSIGLVQQPRVKVGWSFRETLDHDAVVTVLGGQSATTYSFCELLFIWSYEQAFS
jgi:hypothetical protein